MANQLNLSRTVKRISELSFWRSRSRWLKVIFEFKRGFYSFKEFIGNRREDVGILQALVASTLTSFLFSVLSLTIILVLPFSQIADANVDRYDNFLIAVASITGIFLSLYFTGLNTVIGGLYAKSPKPVRELLIQERVNHFSVRFLVFLTLLCLELLAVSILLGNQPILSIYVVVFLGCFAVLFFAELGKRAFYFFDPSLFAKQLGFEIIKWARASTPSGSEFENPAFQDYYRRKSEQALNGFQGLIQLSKTEGHLKETLNEIVTELQGAYVRYLHIKKSIPTKSRWFLYFPVFQDWFTASEFLVRMASVTQTDIRPEDKPQHEWLEEKLEGLEIEALSYALDQKDWNAVEVILGSMFTQFTALGSAGEINRAFSFLERIQTTLQKLLSESVPTPVDWEDEVLKYKLASIQVSSSLTVTLTAGLFNSLENIDLQQLDETCSRLDWTKPSAPYDLHLPFRLLERLEYLYQGLQFEKNSEGKIISPSWYINSLIYQEFGFHLKEVVQQIFTDGLAFFETRVDTYEKASRWVESSIVASDSLEMEAKTRHLIYVARGLAEKLDNERYIKGLSWAEWDWEKLEKRLDEFHEKMIVSQVSHLGVLFTWNKSVAMPDYFGKAVVFAGEECIKSLDANNTNLFSKLFEKYFSGILLTFERMRTTSTSYKPDMFLLLLAEPIMDLFYVSGFALVYSEFHQNPSLFEPCKLAWENLIAKNKKEYIELLAIIVKNKNQSFGITNRDSLRTQWDMIFNHRISSLPKKYEDMGPIAGGMPVVDHPSDLIQVIGRHGAFPISIYKPDDIFIDLYLSTLPKMKDLDFGLKHKVSESMSRRNIRRKKARAKD